MKIPFSWKFWRTFLVVVASIVTVLALLNAEEYWRGKRAWNNYARQMEAEGTDLNFSHYVPPPVPDEQNFAMTPFLAPLFDFVPGTQRMRDTNTQSRMIAQLLPEAPQIDLNRHGSWNRGQALNLVQIANDWNGPEHPPAKPLTPAQTNEAAQLILQKLASSDGIIDELRSAAKRPYSRFIIDYNWYPKFAILLPHLKVLKLICRNLELRACAELALGRTEAATADIALILPMIDSARNEPFLISQLVRVAILETALQPIWEGLRGHEFSDAQLAVFEHDLGGLDFARDAASSLAAERALGISWFDQLHTGQGLDSDVQRMTLVFPRGWWYFEATSYSRLFNEQIQDITMTNGIDPATADQKTQNVLNELKASWLDTVVRRHYMISRLLMPALNSYERRMARAQDDARLALLACALERYRLTNGQYPQTLDALAPQFLPAVPRDIIMHQPFVYRQSAGDNFVLYSVGWNKKDDNGTYPSKESLEFTQGDWVWRN